MYLDHQNLKQCYQRMVSFPVFCYATKNKNVSPLADFYTIRCTIDVKKHIVKKVQKLETHGVGVELQDSSLSCQCYPLSSTAANKCLFRWRHLFEISDFLFSITASSPFAMNTFSAVQRAHFLAVGLYGLAFLRIL